MKAIDLARTLIWPATDLSVLLTYLTYLVLLSAAAAVGIFGLFLIALLLPGLCRYLLMLLEARALGRNPVPPDIDMFLWFGHGWALFPLAWLFVLVYVTYLAGSIFAAGPALLMVAAVLAPFPASMAVLAISHSPTESLRPRAVFGVIRRAGPEYWIAVAVAIGTVLVLWRMSAGSLHVLLQNAIGFYLVFVLFALTGTIVRPLQLDREIDIPDPLQADADELEMVRLKERAAVLGHAYGFISRGNRAGGFRHIEEHIRLESDPKSAWAWFFEKMLGWEKKDHALFFAQRYLGYLLEDGDDTTAVKLMLCCRLENEAFRPLPEDRERATAAARRCGSEELAEDLRAGVP